MFYIMAKICFKCPKGVVNKDKSVTLYYCGIDDDNHKLKTSRRSGDADNFSEGYYLDSELDYIKFHFKDDPLVKYLSCSI